MDHIATLKKLSRMDKIDEYSIVKGFSKWSGSEVEVSKARLDKPGFEIATQDGTYLLLERPVSYYTKNFWRMTTLQQRMIEFSMPVPLYIGEGRVAQTFYSAADSPAANVEVERWISDIFEIDLAAAYFTNYFSKSKVFSDYRLIILEAIECFYMGLDNLAVMGLIPVLEGALRNLQNQLLKESSNTVSAKEFERKLRIIIKEWGARRVAGFDWHPGVYGNEVVELDFFTHICPQADLINSFRLFFRDVLYKPSTVSMKGLNRHLIVHMLGGGLNKFTDFYRVFIALTHIVFIESLADDDIPTFWQGYNEGSRSLGRYIYGLSKIMDNRRALIRSLGAPSYPKSIF